MSPIRFPGGGTAVAPLAHASTHAAAGSDPVTLTLAQISNAGTAAGMNPGTASNQLAVGNHTHALGGLSNVSTSGATSGQALAFNGSTWAPATITGGTAVINLDDLGDVDTTGVASGYVLTRSGSGYIMSAPGGTASSLAGQTDVTLSSPANGDQLTYDLASTKWVNTPGSSSGVTWMVVPQLASDTKIFHNAISITVLSNVLTCTGAGFVNGDVGKKVYWKTGTNTAEIAEIRARTSATVVTLNVVGSGAGVAGTAYSAAATVASQPGAYGTDDTVTLQAAITSAKTLRLPIGLKPSTRAMITTDLDCSNYQGFRLEGLGGGTWVSDINSAQLGGQILYLCKPTAMTGIRCGNNGGSPNNDQANHTGAHISRVGFCDPSERRVHTAVLTQFITRNRLEKLHIVNMLEGWRNNSGSKDASWGSITDSTTLACKTHIVLYNAVPVTDGAKEPTGAQANAILNHTYMINPGEVGCDWYGGQYGKHIGGKMDIDGAGSVGLRFRGGVAYASSGSPPWPAGTSPASGKIQIDGLVVEATGTGMDNTTFVVDIQGGAQGLTFSGCHIGGGGGTGGIGYGIGVNGSGAVQDVQIIGGETINRTIDIWIGSLSRNTTIIGHALGGNGMFIQADAGSDGTLIDAPRFDIGSDPILNAARVNPAATATRFMIKNYRFNGGYSEHPRFPTLAALNTAPVSTIWGDTGSLAYVTAAAPNDGLAVKKAAGWVMV